MYFLEMVPESHLLCRRRHLLVVVLVLNAQKQNKYPGRRDEMHVWEYG